MTVVAVRIDFLEDRRKKLPLAEAILLFPEREKVDTRIDLRSFDGGSEKNDANLTFKNGGFEYTIPPEKIIYISAHGKKTVVHTEWKEYQTSRLLKDLYKLLPESRFMRVHKSYIINLEKFLASSIIWAAVILLF